MGQAHARLTRHLVGSGLELGIDQACNLDIDRLKPFDDQSQDFVVANDVLGRVANPLGLLDAIHRVLRPGGALLVLLPDGPEAREATPLAHVVDHYHRQITEVDDDHVVEFIRNHEDAATVERFEGLPDKQRNAEIERHRRRSIQAHSWRPDGFREVLRFAVDELGHGWDFVEGPVADAESDFAIVLRRRYESAQLTNAGRVYGRWYYDNALGIPCGDHEHWADFFGKVADNIVRQLEPRTVLDAGCAKGYLVAALREREVAAHGFDISEVAIAEAVERARGHVRVGSLTEPIEQRYDLVTCVEVIEHLDPADTATAVANLCQVTDRVLLCSTPHDLGEVTHTNVRPPEHWSQLFAAHGFFRDFRHDTTYLTPWAALYRRERKTTTELVVDYDREWARLRAETIEQRKALLHLHNELERAGNDLEQLRHAAVQAGDDRERLDQILASRSWRMAWALGTPIRMLRRSTQQVS